jgi:hypothetical protein
MCMFVSSRVCLLVRIMYTMAVSLAKDPAGQSVHEDTFPGEYFPRPHWVHIPAWLPEDVPVQCVHLWVSVCMYVFFDYFSVLHCLVSR